MLFACRKTLWSDFHVGEFSRTITCKTRFRTRDPNRKTKCDPTYDAIGNTKVCAALQFPRIWSTICGGSRGPLSTFVLEGGGRHPGIMPPFGTQSSFPPSLLCTSPKGFTSQVSCFSVPSLLPTARCRRQRPARLASSPVLAAQFVFLFV